MTRFRDFTAGEGHLPVARNIEDAPPGLRRELLDVAFAIVEERDYPALRPDQLYRIICQSIGARVAGEPYGGYRYATSRELERVEWFRVYDLIVRLLPEFGKIRCYPQFRNGVNRILAGYGVCWDLNEDGRLVRVLPQTTQALVQAAINELRRPDLNHALEQFNNAVEAYNAIPRRDRDVCANVFDSMESTAKVVYALPAATFGGVIAHVRRIAALNEHVIATLEDLNTLANRQFRHGTPFNLSSREVDWVYLTCIGGVLMFAR